MNRSMIVIGTSLMVLGLGLAVYGFVKADDAESAEPASGDTSEGYYLMGTMGIGIGIAGISVFVHGILRNYWVTGGVVRRGVLYPPRRKTRQVQGQSAKTPTIGVSYSQGDPIPASEFGDNAAPILHMGGIKRLESGDARMVVSGSPGPKKLVLVHRELAQWSFKTSFVVASETISRGVARVSADVLSTFGVSMKSGVTVTATYDGRSKRLKLLLSEDLDAAEVELNKDDIEDLGITHGRSGYLEIAYRDHSRPGMTADHRETTVVATPNPEFDNDSPPYVVESGFDFLKRRKRD